MASWQWTSCVTALTVHVLGHLKRTIQFFSIEVRVPYCSRDNLKCAALYPASSLLMPYICYFDQLPLKRLLSRH
jgi:hypothetical protein